MNNTLGKHVQQNKYFVTKPEKSYLWPLLYVLPRTVCTTGVHTGFTVWGGKLKTFGVYVMGVHKQAPSRGGGGGGVCPSPPDFFLLQNRCSQIDSDTVASRHRIYTIIIRKANHTQNNSTWTEHSRLTHD